MNSKVYKISSEFELRRVFRPSGCERPHTHSELTITAVSGGSLQLRIGKKSVSLEKDKTVIIFPEQQHFSEFNSEEIENVYVIYISDTAFDPNGFSFPQYSQVFQTVKDQSFHKSFISLCEYLLSSASDTTKKETFKAWLKNDLKKQLELETASFPAPSKNELAEAIKKILDNYMGNRAPMEAIADAFGRSKEHCNRVFKAAYNLSIQAYFLNLKAHRAKNLLDSEKDSLGEVAWESGFYDQSHFTRIFKDIFQMTPEEFRKAMKK